jgi:hypothetical protein
VPRTRATHAIVALAWTRREHAGRDGPAEAGRRGARPAVGLRNCLDFQAPVHLPKRRYVSNVIEYGRVYLTAAGRALRDGPPEGG